MPTRNQNKEIVKYVAVRHLIANDKVAEELFAIQRRYFE